MPYYLAPYIGAGTFNDPFRPRTDQRWSAIDLRADASRRDGDGLDLALIHVLEDDPDPHLIKLASHRFDTIGDELRRAIASRLNLVSLDARRLDHFAAEVLMAPPRNAWNPLQPVLGQYEVWLGDLLWSAPALRGGVEAGDDFERPDNTDIGAEWTQLTSDAGWARLDLTGGMVHPSALSTECFEYWNAASFQADQFAQVTLGVYVDSASNHGYAAATRMQIGLRSIYYCFALRSSGANFSGLRKYVNNTVTDLTSGVSSSWAVPDVLRLTTLGSVHTGFRNGTTLIGPATDTQWTSGPPGMGMYLDGGTLTDARSNNWRAGELFATPPPPSSGRPSGCM